MNNFQNLIKRSFFLLISFRLFQHWKNKKSIKFSKCQSWKIKKIKIYGYCMYMCKKKNLWKNQLASTNNKKNNKWKRQVRRMKMKKKMKKKKVIFHYQKLSLFFYRKTAFGGKAVSRLLTAAWTLYSEIPSTVIIVLKSGWSINLNNKKQVRNR